MFCDSCGAQVQSDQRFCGTCGKPMGMVVAGRVSSRVTDHRNLLAILWLVYSMMTLIGAGVLFVLSNTLFVHIANLPQTHGGPPLTFLQPLMSFIAMVILCKAVLGLSAGIGLMQRQHWARMIALVAGFVALISIPFGTALGIYTIWVFLSAGAEQDYAKLSESAG